MSITVKEHAPGGDIDDFLRAGEVVFAGDPQWIKPLAFDIKQRLHPKKNPFFKRAEAVYFTAWRDGKLVGRCSASHRPRAQQALEREDRLLRLLRHVDDDAVGKALLDHAAGSGSRPGG
jgi:hypothetical protein